VETLKSYLVGVDVAKMVRRQPSLLGRDVHVSLPLKLRALSGHFGDACAAMVERQPALLFGPPEERGCREAAPGDGAIGAARDGGDFDARSLAALTALEKAHGARMAAITAREEASRVRDRE